MNFSVIAQQLSMSKKPQKNLKLLPSLLESGIIQKKRSIGSLPNEQLVMLSHLNQTEALQNIDTLVTKLIDKYYFTINQKEFDKLYRKLFNQVLQYAEDEKINKKKLQEMYDNRYPSLLYFLQDVGELSVSYQDNISRLKAIVQNYQNYHPKENQEFMPPLLISPRNKSRIDKFMLFKKVITYLC